MRTVAAIVAAHLVVLASACGRAPERPAPRAPNLLLITIDTLRADRLGKERTPALDALASGGLRFTNARTTAPLTLPAHVSILTGQLPPATGARLNGVPVRLEQTLASRLQTAGYRTGAVVGAFVLDRRFGLASGFADYDDAIPRSPDAVDQLQAERRANVVVDTALEWLKDSADDRPWFLWVHVYDPHAPYADGYDRDVAYADGELARLLQQVSARSDAAHTAIIALGDHGESLGEHGEATHGMLLTEAALRVPLIVVAPTASAAVRNDPASVIDVVPTALALAGVSPDPLLPGKNLLADRDSERESYAETDYPSVAGWQPTRALIQDRWKLVVATRPRLYDLQGSGESRDLSLERAQLVQAMSKRLEELGRNDPARVPATKAVSPEVAARLRSLGYVAPTSPPTLTTASGVDAQDVIADWVAFERALSIDTAGRPADALPAFEALAKKQRNGLVFQSTYARTLARVGRTSDAVAVYKRAAARWPTDAALYHELAVAARDAGDAQEAQRAEEAALTLAPDLPTAQNGLGLLHADHQRHAEAARAFERAIALDPTNAVYMVNLGNARRALGDLDAAATAYRRALDRDASLADAANGLGVVLVQQHRAADAVRYFEQAVARDRGFAEAQLNLGIALQESGHPDRALAQYRLVETLPGAGPRERASARTLRQQLEKP